MVSLGANDLSIKRCYTFSSVVHQSIGLQLSGIGQQLGTWRSIEKLLDNQYNLLETKVSNSVCYVWYSWVQRTVQKWNKTYAFQRRHSFSSSNDISVTNLQYDKCVKSETTEVYNFMTSHFHMQVELGRLFLTVFCTRVTWALVNLKIIHMWVWNATYLACDANIFWLISTTCINQ